MYIDEGTINLFKNKTKQYLFRIANMSLET